MKKIKIISGKVEVEAELNDTKTASSIWGALPITGSVNTWGDEIYFNIPVKCASENQKEVVELGELGYWLPGSAFCIFFGPTPASRGNEIRPANPVNVFGKITGDVKINGKIDSRGIKALRDVSDGDKIIIEAVK
ncbi:MAG: cyclophilin-like fold protein [Candidatus Firestonebacteria bacterium]